MDFGNQNNSRGNPTNIIVVVGVLTVVFAIGGFIISTFTPSLFPAQASAEAEQVDQLFRILLGIGGGLFLFVQGLLLYSVIRFRVRKGDTGDGPTIHGNTTLEMVWTAIPSIVVLVLVIYSWQVWTDIREPKENEMIVQATAARYAWTFEYEMPSAVYAALDDEQKALVDEAGTITSPELHVYPERPVRMVMNTQDVIHAFWVPAMRIKQDLLPGRTTEVRFTPQLPDDGEIEPVMLSGQEFDAMRYRVVCTELCGAGHGQMFSYVNIYSDEATYMDAMTALWDPVINPSADPVIVGRQLLASGAYPCSGCHILQDEGIDWAGVTGPALTGVGERAPDRAASAGIGSPGEYLYRSLYHPQEYYVPGYQGVNMNQFQPDDPSAPNYMPPRDVYYIVAYLCSLDGTDEETCDQENLLNVINTDNPDNPVVLEAAGEVDEVMAETTAEAETTPEAEATDEAVTGDVESTPEAEATEDASEVEETPEAEATPDAEATEEE